MAFYTGAAVSSKFMSNWRSKQYTGSNTPTFSVKVRQGRFIHAFRPEFGPAWPDPQFGRIMGRDIHIQWYPDWEPQTPWYTLPGVHQIDLNQSFDNNGIAVATVSVDNVAWQAATGSGGAYHTKQRGWLWPWRGYTPAKRPGSGDAKNQWYNFLPNAQIMISQGYGAATLVRTFTGTIDSIGPAGVRPDKTTLTCRDFGSVLVDSHVYGWNKDRILNDPIFFCPPHHPKLDKIGGDPKQKNNGHRVILINDVTDIVRCALRWAGFKAWEIQDAGITLNTPLRVDKSSTWMDVINVVKEQLGYVFFIGEPTDDESLGVPIFRRPTVLIPARNQPIASLVDTQLLTDNQPKHDNINDRFIIRVRGMLAPRNKGGRVIWGGDMNADGQLRFTYTYCPPYLPTQAGIIKQLTYYNGGKTDMGQAMLGFTSKKECAVAALLITTQIMLGRDTTIAQCPGAPHFGLDSFAYIQDAANGVASRLYVTNRHTVQKLGGDGSKLTGGGSTSEGDMLWASELGGALVDNPEWDTVIQDYNHAINGRLDLINQWRNNKIPYT